MSRSRRAASELSVLALELDHFKKLNDTFGHIAGDLVLRELGARLSQTPLHGRAHERKRVHYSLTETDPCGASRAGVRM